MLGRLLLLLLVVPLIELTLLMMLADWTNWQTAVATVVITGVTGSLLIRYQGWRTVQRIRADLAEQRLPGDALLDGVLIFIAGLLLLTPGILTDLVGIFLLVPPGRALVKAYLLSRFRARFTSHTVVEGTFVRRAGEQEWLEQRRED